MVTEWAHRQPVEENMTRTLELSNFFERDYFDDMTALGIKKPDVLTRVWILLFYYFISIYPHRIGEKYQRFILHIWIRSYPMVGG